VSLKLTLAVHKVRRAGYEIVCHYHILNSIEPQIIDHLADAQIQTVVKYTNVSTLMIQRSIIVTHEREYRPSEQSSCQCPNEQCF
jgi:hypothetical protein